MDAADSVVRVQQMVGDNLEEHGALFKVIVLNAGHSAVPFGLGSIGALSGKTPVAVIDRNKVAESRTRRNPRATRWAR